jgi:hypothetical protein
MIRMLNDLKIPSSAIDWYSADRVKQLVWYADLMAGVQEEKACA